MAILTVDSLPYECRIKPVCFEAVDFCCPVVSCYNKDRDTGIMGVPDCLAHPSTDLEQSSESFLCIIYHHHHLSLSSLSCCAFACFVCYSYDATFSIIQSERQLVEPGRFNLHHNCTVMKILSIALIGKLTHSGLTLNFVIYLVVISTGRQNQPLFIRSYGKPGATAEEDLKWHFVAHTSLDVFEERGEANFALSRLCTWLTRNAIRTNRGVQCSAERSLCGFTADHGRLRCVSLQRVVQYTRPGY
jgi:hypothetical protein